VQSKKKRRLPLLSLLKKDSQKRLIGLAAREDHGVKNDRTMTNRKNRAQGRAADSYLGTRVIGSASS